SRSRVRAGPAPPRGALDARRSPAARRQARERLMLDFPRWKIWSICLGLGLLMLLAVPSFVPKDVRATWPSWMQQTHINLGLDLAGGSHLLYEADVNGPQGLINQRLEQKSEEVATAM